MHIKDTHTACADLHSSVCATSWDLSVTEMFALLHSMVHPVICLLLSIPVCVTKTHRFDDDHQGSFQIHHCIVIVPFGVASSPAQTSRLKTSAATTVVLTHSAETLGTHPSLAFSASSVSPSAEPQH